MNAPTTPTTSQRPTVSGLSASDLQDEAQRLIDAGYLPVPIIRQGKHVPNGDTPEYVYRAADFATATAIQVRTGRQPHNQGLIPLYLVALDFDQHKPWHNADARLDELRRAAGPATFARLPHKSSTGGQGWHLQFYSPIPIPSQTIYDPDGRHAGELICVGTPQRTSVPAFTPVLLSQDERDRILGACRLRRAASPSGCTGLTDRKADIRAGLALVRGYERQHAPELHSFLEAGLKHRSKKVQAVATRMLDLLGTPGLNRSADYANLVQHLMLRASELGASSSERYRRVMNLAMASDAFGKGSEKGYNQETDTAALIYRISVGATRQDGECFILPGWCKQSTSVEAAPVEVAPEPEPLPRPVGRPAGERNAQVAKLRRLLQRLAEDDVVSGFTVDYLAEQMDVKKRSVQNYLHDLEVEGEIARGQLDGNGRLIIILKSPNRGASNYQQAAKTPADTLQVRGASETPTEAIPTRQTGENASDAIRKEDHQNPCAPPPVGPAPAPVVSKPAAVADEMPVGRTASLPGSGSGAVGVQGFGDPLRRLAGPAESSARGTSPGVQRRCKRQDGLAIQEDAYRPLPTLAEPPDLELLAILEGRISPSSMPAACVVACDYKGNISPYGVYWCVAWPDGSHSEPTEYKDYAERAIERREGAARAAGSAAIGPHLSV